MSDFLSLSSESLKIAYELTGDHGELVETQGGVSRLQCGVDVNHGVFCYVRFYVWLGAPAPSCPIWGLDEAHVAQRLQRMVSQALGQGSDSAFLDARLWGPR